MAYRVINENESTRELLVKCASELLREKGSAFTIREVCAKAGVSVGTFYTYYKNKNELILERLNRRDRFMIEELKNAPTEPEARMIAIAASYIDYSLERGVVSVRDVYHSMLLNGVTTVNDRETYLYRELADTIAAGVACGAFIPELDQQQFADTVLCALRGVNYNWCYYSGEGFDPKERACHAVSLLVSAIRKR
ncbi:MAG: TetR/AcrR family transcriptional regulator [Clostridia bacterium]|nr:TetR/AcrR family transcriptional regulator [Clostridia bacterium]